MRGSVIPLDGIFPPEELQSGFPLNMDYYFDDFFEDVDYVGAFRTRDSAWIWNWTELYNW